MGCKFYQLRYLSGLGPMYFCTLYSCTQVHILEYSDVLCTPGIMYSVLVLEYIHKVLVLSEYILFHEQKSCSHVIILISMILMIYICILQRMMCTVIYQYHASCFFSPILVYVHIYQILCYMDLLASWFAPIKHP